MKKTKNKSKTETENSNDKSNTATTTTSSRTSKSTSNTTNNIKSDDRVSEYSISSADDKLHRDDISSDESSILHKSDTVKLSRTKNKYDITIEEVKYIKRHDLISSELVIKLEGKDCNFKILNTLSRIAQNNIPNYAFHTKLINIEQNTCVAFNNDYMKLRLSQLPIFDMELDLSFLHNKYWKGINYADPERPIHPAEKKIKAYLNVNNDTHDIKAITTNDLKLYIDSEEITMYDVKNPILLILLRPNDSFICNMSAALGVGEQNIIFSACSNSWIEYTDENNKFIGHLYINSRGSFTEYDILIKCCDYMIKKCNDLIQDTTQRLERKEIEHTSKLILDIDDEDHTLGEILNYELQSNNKIEFSGVAKQDLLIKSIKFKITCKNKEDSVITCIIESLNILIDKFTHILEQVKLISQKKN